MSHDTLLTFPCRFPIKIMGINHQCFEQEIMMIVRQHVPALGEDAVQTRTSKNAKYLSMTITIMAEKQTQLDHLYQALHAHPDVKMIL